MEWGIPEDQTQIENDFVTIFTRVRDYNQN
jgi:hypothetical protein